jgi:hypothetical protein
VVHSTFHGLNATRHQRAKALRMAVQNLASRGRVNGPDIESRESLFFRKDECEAQRLEP